MLRLDFFAQIGYFLCTMTKHYSIEQAQLVNHVRTKVAALFDEFDAPAHGFDHAERVAAYAVRIAGTEGYKDIYLAEIAALVHDIGRTTEHNNPAQAHLGHHELSYIMLQKWFNSDDAFDVLDEEIKKKLLYSVRYHWNNAADEYELAWILRDADKLDMLGKKGIERTIEFAKTEEDLQMDIRIKYDSIYWIKTKTAKQICKEKKLVEYIDDYYMEFLKQFIYPVVV